jgi:hypothetical protein
LALKPAFALSGMAAFGSGIHVKKGLYNGDSSIDFITPAHGLSVDADTSLIEISYRGFCCLPAV